MFEVFWYWFVAILEEVATVKTKIAQYESYELDNMISGDGGIIGF